MPYNNSPAILVFWCQRSRQNTQWW